MKYLVLLVIILSAVALPLMTYAAPVDNPNTDIVVSTPTPIVVTLLEPATNKLREDCEYIRFLEFRQASRRLEMAERYNTVVGSISITDLKEMDLPVSVPLEGPFLCEYRDPTGFDIDPPS